jgi:hypothetical protein
LEKLVEWCRVEKRSWSHFVFERVDSAQITLGLFGKFILLGCGVVAMVQRSRQLRMSGLMIRRIHLARSNVELGWIG